METFVLSSDEETLDLAEYEGAVRDFERVLQVGGGNVESGSQGKADLGEEEGEEEEEEEEPRAQEKAHEDVGVRGPPLRRRERARVPGVAERAAQERMNVSLQDAAVQQASLLQFYRSLNAELQHQQLLRFFFDSSLSLSFSFSISLVIHLSLYLSL